MTARRGFRIGLLGASGAVGTEILELLAQRSLPVAELRAFASEASPETLDFRGESLPMRRPEAAALTSCDLVICAAPDVLHEQLPALRDSSTRVVDVSGVLELDPAVPLYLAGVAALPPTTRLAAIPCGVVAGAGLALAPIARETELSRVTLVCLESASSAGLCGVSELTEHTVEVLNQMTGETLPSGVFPQSLAFDCIPQVGALLPDGGSQAEHQLRLVLRRLLGAPSLPVEVTRVLIPVFGGSVAAVSLALSHDLSPQRARELWEKAPGLRVLAPDALPTPRSVLGHDEVAIGRLRRSREDAPGLAFVLALDNLRRGAALGAVDAAEILLG